MDLLKRVSARARTRVACFGFIMLILFISTNALAQSDADASPPEKFEDSRNPKVFFRHLAEDQARLWTSPLRVKPQDAEWLVPVAGIATGLIMTDRTSGHEIFRQDWVNSSDAIANYGLGAYGGVLAGLYFFGHRSGNLRQQETALLAGEAGINALALSTVLKYVFERNRPFEGDGKGHFFRPVSGSFYSSHAAIAWSFASVISSEYPGWLSRTLAYGGATAISFARISGQKHWPSDVFVGSVAGYLTGKNVFRARHDPNVDREFYGVFVRPRVNWNVGNAGTTYVPLDSWVYPVIERLMSAGLIRYGYLGLRPYTRTSVAEMIAEAEYRLSISGAPVSPMLEADIESLKNEFNYETKLGTESDNRAISVERLYSRSTYISGQPLTDGFHFGQTVINDFGRPYQGGFNNVTGFIARAETGRFAFFVRGEYQHSPGADAYPLAIRLVIAQQDVNALQPPKPIATTNAFRLLDTYASMTLVGHNISIGKQSLWWGPDEGGAMILSDNAEPIYMARVNRTVPLKIPGLSRLTGPFRYDFFFGKLSDHQFPPNPYMHGEKISFKPTENLEFGFSRTAVFAGEGLTPLTFATFWSSLTSTVSSTSLGSDLRKSPGVRHGQFDFSYRLPWLRKWVTLYTDSLVHDDVSPIDAPRRAAIEPGIYISHFPKLPKLDLRVEAASTDPAIRTSNGGRFFYWESRYKDAYVNKGFLMGSWIGRESKGFQARSTYWISPVSKIQFDYRNQKVAKDFLPQGDTLNSYGIKGTFRVNPEWEIVASTQYDWWKAPVLADGLQSNLTTSVQVTFWPRRWSATSNPQK